MNIYFSAMVLLISLPSFCMQTADITLPELGDRVSGAVSQNDEKIESFAKKNKLNFFKLSDRHFKH